MRRKQGYIAASLVLLGVLATLGAPPASDHPESMGRIAGSPPRPAESHSATSSATAAPLTAAQMNQPLPVELPAPTQLAFEPPASEDAANLQVRDYSAYLRSQDPRKADRIVPPGEARAAARTRIREALVTRLNAKLGERSPDPHAPTGDNP